MSPDNLFRFSVNYIIFYFLRSSNSGMTLSRTKRDEAFNTRGKGSQRIAKQLKERYRPDGNFTTTHINVTETYSRRIFVLRWRYCSEQKTTGIIFERPGLFLSCVSRFYRCNALNKKATDAHGDTSCVKYFFREILQLHCSKYDYSRP